MAVVRRPVEVALARADRQIPAPHRASSRLPARNISGWRRRIWGERAPTTLELKELDEFLLARAMEHDSPTFRPGQPSTILDGIVHLPVQQQSAAQASRVPSSHTRTTNGTIPRGRWLGQLAWLS